MIIRPVSRSHICLSCRRNLAKCKYPTAYQVARQSTDSSLQHISEQASAEQLQDDTPPVNHGNVVRRAFGQGPKASRHPLGRLHGHRGVKLRENLEKLNSTSLGEAAEVIVLRDSMYSVYEHDKEKLDPQEAEHIDILGQLADERGLIRQEEINKNIDSFRPQKGDEPADWDDINELVQQLQDSFTISQMERYMEGFEGRREPESPPAEWATDEEKAPIVRITPWQPGVSDITDHFDNDPLRGYFLESHTAKQRVILRLLRECWMVELPELEEGIGQFEIEVHQDNLAILMMGSFSVLDSINADHLPLDEERLEVFPPRSVIRVTTSHFKKNSIVQEVEKALNSVHKRRLALENLFLPSPLEKGFRGRLQRWAQKNFDDATLQELSQLSTTSITRKPKHKILISALKGEEDNLSSRLDLAARLLLNSGAFSDRVKYQLACHAPDTTNGALIGHPSIEGLPWRKRLRDWSRWTTPIPKESCPTGELDFRKALSILVSTPGQSQEKAASRKTATAEPTKTGDGSAYWASDLFTETSVLMGSVLHSPLAPIGNPRSVPSKTLARDSIIHSFSSVVPNISRVLSKATPSGERKQQLIMRFQPNPFYHPPTPKGEEIKGPIGAAALSAFPPIEMTFDFADDEQKTAKLKDVQAIVSESKTDVMLPENAVDLRFQQRTTSRLKRRYIEQLQDFLKKSKLALAGSGPLETPPSITLPISSHICREPDFELLGDKYPKSTSSEDLREVEYLFTSLEVRLSLAFQYKGWLLLYTSFEGGRPGGRRGELRLRPSRFKSAVSEEEFVEMAYKLAEIIGDSSKEDKEPKTPRKVTVNNDDLVRRFVTREAKTNKTFKYFAKRPDEWSLERKKERREEESEMVDEEGDDEGGVGQEASKSAEDGNGKDNI